MIQAATPTIPVIARTRYPSCKSDQGDSLSPLIPTGHRCSRWAYPWDIVQVCKSPEISEAPRRRTRMIQRAEEAENLTRATLSFLDCVESFTQFVSSDQD